MSKILEVRKVSNHFDGEPLLRDVSFSLEKGEILCLLGPSGSGKTTLLRLLAGLEEHDDGEIVFDGKNLNNIPPHKRQVGMMFQEYALFPHKNVYENVSFGLEMQKCPDSERKERINHMLRLVGLSHFGHRRIDELSGGERQRVALARSLAPEPRLLLLDEPLGSLDRILRDRLTGEIRFILKELGVTAVFVTHDQAEAFSVADKVAVLQNGILHQFDTPERVYRKPANMSVARFLGFTNFISGEMSDTGHFMPTLSCFDDVHLQLAEQRPRDVQLLIRPEGACLVHEGESSNLPIVSGIVKKRRFQGSSYRMSIMVEGHDLVFDLAIDPTPPGKNQEIHLSLKKSSLVLVFDNSTN